MFSVLSFDCIEEIYLKVVTLYINYNIPDNQHIFELSKSCINRRLLGEPILKYLIKIYNF